MTKKGFELLLGNRDLAFSLMLPLVLLPAKVNAVMQEKCCKENTIRAIGSGGGKVILILLVKVIVFHVGLTTIDVR